MAESSSTPLPRKLGIKAGQRLAFVNPSVDFPALIGPLPIGAELMPGDGDEEGLDLIVFFAHDRAEMDDRLVELMDRLAPAGGLWVCWPKKSSGVATDLSDDVVRNAGLEAGLVDNKVCAIDATWSAQRFVFRLRDRPRK